MFDEFGQARGNDLPGEAELILEPAALDLGATDGELRPVVVDLLLVVTAHDEGDGFGELECWATVECGELLAVEFEGDGEDGALRPPGRCRYCVMRRKLCSALIDSPFVL